MLAVCDLLFGVCPGSMIGFRGLGLRGGVCPGSMIGFWVLGFGSLGHSPTVSSSHTLNY